MDGPRVNLMEKNTATVVTGFEIGIAEIDAQHRRLFDLLNQLRSWSGKGYEYAATIDTLNELADYTHTHFAVEESLMRMLRYPGITAHIAEHERLKKMLEEYRHSILKEGSRVELSDFIQSWLIDHISKVDREYVDHFLAARIDPAAGPSSLR
jgi:hemerythrin